MEFFRKMFGFDKKKTQERIKTIKREELDSASSSARKCRRAIHKRKDMEYAGEIYKYLRRVERVFAPKNTFLQNKEQFRRGERQKAVEWMVDIVHSLELKRETLYTGVSLFDRYVELMSPENSCLGLLALTCLFVAYKYEEVAYLYKEVLALRTFQGKTHDSAEIYNQEMEILTSLGWRLSHLGPMSFFDVLAAGSTFCTEAYDIAQMIAECLLMSGFTTMQQSSLLGAAIYWIVLRIDGNKEWTMDISAKSLYTEKAVVETVAAIIKFLKEERLTNEKFFCFGNTSYKIENILSTLKPHNIEKRLATRD
jgi:hypothetical protein